MMTDMQQCWLIATLLCVPLVMLLASVWRLIEVVRACIDVHMRVQCGIHKELCALNDRLNPAQSPEQIQQRLDERLRSLGGAK